ncbi:glutamine amidotransferase-related protein [Meiothermus rufus]|uniref:glutamine amidotransferase-related protein n=1 Tax=Meiothermus rufus TaxID=604332 RepID=UPI000429EC06|nr:glutamine amidotransferase [Meiothermus rufus]
MRLAVLVCDEPPLGLEGLAGDYPAMFERLLGLPLTPFDVRAGHYPARVADFAGYLITGSRASVYDPLPWIPPLEDFVRSVVTSKSRLVGICFGHQMIGQALGGRVERWPGGWGVGVHCFSIDRTMPWMAPPLAEVRLILSCQDQITQLPPGAVVLGGSAFSPHALIQVGPNVLGLQPHPEFSKAFAEALLEMRREQVGVQRYAEAKASFALEPSSKEVAGWIRNFLSTAPS